MIQSYSASTGMYETLDELVHKGTTLGIITNGGGFSQNAKIDTLGIRDYMKIILVSELINLRKPDARIFTVALEQLNVDSRET